MNVRRLRRASFFIFAVVVATRSALASPTPIRATIAATGARTVTEYRRMSGHVRTSRGARFHFVVTCSREPLAPMSDARVRTQRPWDTRALWSVTYAIIGEDNSTHISGTVVDRETPKVTGVVARDSIDVDGEILRETTRGVTIAVSDARGSLDVIASPRKRMMRVSTTERDMSRMDVRATFMIDGRREHASGMGWFERFDRDDRRDPAIERYEIQLDDGRDVLIETLRPTTPTAFARRTLRELVIAPNGTMRRLAPVGGPHGALVAWHSLHTGIDYPILWGVTIPSEELRISLEPVIEDQEWNTGGRGRPFWDGAVDVYDVTPGTPGARLGSGYILQTP